MKTIKLKQLIIAEKPSVAAEISSALGKFKKHKQHFENSEYIVSSSIGHLIELKAPGTVKKNKWILENLPEIPEKFILNPIERTKSRLEFLIELINKEDVESIVNACDAGREGELIFRYIMEYANVAKPIYRLWLSSMTKQSILDGLKELRTGVELDNLASAARARAEADWIVGINSTRAITAFNSIDGGFKLTTVGRVQTPTLSIMVDREEKISSFTKNPYWTIDALFTNNGYDYKSSYYDEKLNKEIPGIESRFINNYRFWDKKDSEKILKNLENIKEIKYKETKKPSKQSSPLLFDLTSLQRDSNRLFGLSAKTTLTVAQALYEKHRLITYPRTDSRALPDDYVPVVKKLISSIAELDEKVLNNRAKIAKEILANHPISKKNKRVFNSTKVSDHFAIIPTKTIANNLSPIEEKVYLLIVNRFLSVLLPPAEYAVTTRITTINNKYKFYTEGKMLLVAGWKIVYGKESKDEEAISPINDDDPIILKDINIQEHSTKALPRYNDGSLLSAMEFASNLVENEELKSSLEKRGLGTPATRATIIENLIKEGYVIRSVKELTPTHKAISLIKLIKCIKIDELSSAELTAEWEQKLSKIEHGELNATEFMSQIKCMARRIVEKTKNIRPEEIKGDYKDIKVSCPMCSQKLKESYQYYSCVDCSFRQSKTIASRLLSVEEFETLLTEYKIGPLEGFMSRFMKPFIATLKFDPETSTINFLIENKEEDFDAESAPKIAICPSCSGNILDSGSYYICDGNLKDINKCSLKVSKIILGRIIDEEQIIALSKNLKTDLLTGFISKSRKPFSAHLVIKDGGGIGFQFAPRKTKGSDK